MFGWLRKIFPSSNDRLLKRYTALVASVQKWDGHFQSLDSHSLQEYHYTFRERLERGELLDALLPEAFALVREVAGRVLDMRHFDVQLVGGMVLYEGKIAEMKTGEGKTLIATLPAYLNALTNEPVHIVTVNDYLATRDTEWMGKIYRALGMSVGYVISSQLPQARKLSYDANITYGTNNEFGFDYLRDNMVASAAQQVQRGLGFAVVDEVDSILVDEARTPLIISGPGQNNPKEYQIIDKLAGGLVLQKSKEGKGEEEEEGDYSVDEKNKQVSLTEEGHQRVEGLLDKENLLKNGEDLYHPSNIAYLHHINSALRAQVLYKRNVDYIVKNRKIVIIDEFTGRVMPGRRWSDGLHQAIEAKEKVSIEADNQTRASITFQNYFRLYDKLSGMTGTADTEAGELLDIYGLEVVLIPTHKEMVREDRPDRIYLTEVEKFDAIGEEIADCVDRGQPVLVGTASVEMSEKLSELLKKKDIKHQVLNAKNHALESTIITQAGSAKAVTIATNMAGRGTDIVLGGLLETQLANAPKGSHAQVREQWVQANQAVKKAGGLHVIGTERHESRRVDNQLRGRSGRQGDPGSSAFFLSLEDKLLRIFAGDKVKAIMGQLGMDKGEAIEHPWVTKAVENAQSKVETFNYDIRKTLLEYDNIANEQRKIVYKQRNTLVRGNGLKTSVEDIFEDACGDTVKRLIGNTPLRSEWNIEGMSKYVDKRFGIDLNVVELESRESLGESELTDILFHQMRDAYRDKKSKQPSEYDAFEKVLMLQILDFFWQRHLVNLEHLRQGIGLRSFAQKNPKHEYQRESFALFEETMDCVRTEFVSVLMRTELQKFEDSASPAKEEQQRLSGLQYSHPDASKAGIERLGSGGSKRVRRAGISGAGGQKSLAKVKTFSRQRAKIKRNDKCYCGSGKKYKFCHDLIDNKPEAV